MWLLHDMSIICSDPEAHFAGAKMIWYSSADIPLVPIWNGPSTRHVLLKENRLEVRASSASGAMRGPYWAKERPGNKSTHKQNNGSNEVLMREHIL